MISDSDAPPGSPDDLAVQIGTALADDAAGIARVHVSTWQRAYEGLMPADYLASLSVSQREPIWREILATGTSGAVVARQHKEVVGFVVFGRSRDCDAVAGMGEIHALYVLPSWWSRGIGRELWFFARARLCEQGFARVSLWVLAENVRAVRFYRTAGFELDPTRSQQIVRGGRTLHEVRYVAALTR